MRSLKQEIIKVDFSLTLEQAKDHQSQKYVRCIALNGRWMRVWDAALDQGPSGTIAPFAILKVLCKTTFADRRCPMENCAYVLLANSSLSESFLSSHTNISTDLHSLIDSTSASLMSFLILVSNSVLLCEITLFSMSPIYQGRIQDFVQGGSRILRALTRARKIRISH